MATVMQATVSHHAINVNLIIESPCSDKHQTASLHKHTHAEPAAAEVHVRYRRAQRWRPFQGRFGPGAMLVAVAPA